MIPREVLLRMATLGLSPDHAAAVASMLADVEAATKAEAEAVVERSRAKTRDRVAKWRDAHPRNVTSVTKHSRAGDARVEDITSNSEDNHHSENKKTSAAAPLAGFDEWYALYPHKVQRGAAEKAWPKARAIATLPELMAGLKRYIASKPPDRPYLNPATWLNGKSWMNQPAEVTPLARGSPPGTNKSFSSFLLNDLRQSHEAHQRPTDSDTLGALFHLPATAGGRG